VDNFERCWQINSLAFDPAPHVSAVYPEGVQALTANVPPIPGTVLTLTGTVETALRGASKATVQLLTAL